MSWAGLLGSADEASLREALRSFTEPWRVGHGPAHPAEDAPTRHPVGSRLGPHGDAAAPLGLTSVSVRSST